MVGEFFTRQVAKLATSTPESVDRMHKILTQRVREKLGQQVGKQVRAPYYLHHVQSAKHRNSTSGHTSLLNPKSTKQQKKLTQCTNTFPNWKRWLRNSVLRYSS